MAAVILALLGALAIVVPVAVASMRREVVKSSSIALAELHQLNESYCGMLTYGGSITYQWLDVVGSKAKFDRYDLTAFFLARLTVVEDEIKRRLALQQQDVAVYA